MQSSEHDAAFLEARIGAFLRRVPALLGAMNAADFRAHRQALISQKLERDRSLAEETARHWAPITLGTRDFERARHDAAAQPDAAAAPRLLGGVLCARTNLRAATRAAAAAGRCARALRRGLPAMLALKSTLRAYPCPGPSQ